MADTDFDIIIIGSGPGGYVTAIRSAQLGFKTAIVERDYLGGICLNWGCIPTKALLRSAEIYHYMQHAKDYGLSAGNVGYDAAAVVQRSRNVSKRLNDGVGFLMKKNKVAVIWGEAMIEAPGKVSVKAVEERGPQRRARPGRLPGQALDHRHRRTPARAVRASSPTRSWSGRISRPWRPTACRSRSWSSARARSGSSSRRFYRTFGAEVTVVEVLPQILPGRGCRDRRLRAQGLREAGHQNSDRRQGDKARKEDRQRHRDHRRRQGRHPDRSSSSASSRPWASPAISRISGSRSSA